jgi:hypothetical protein
MTGGESVVGSDPTGGGVPGVGVDVTGGGSLGGPGVTGGMTTGGTPGVGVDTTGGEPGVGVDATGWVVVGAAGLDAVWVGAGVGDWATGPEPLGEDCPGPDVG